MRGPQQAASCDLALALVARARGGHPAVMRSRIRALNAAATDRAEHHDGDDVGEQRQMGYCVG
jgi:hypothetical protein